MPRRTKRAANDLDVSNGLAHLEERSSRRARFLQQIAADMTPAQRYPLLEKGELSSRVKVDDQVHGLIMSLYVDYTHWRREASNARDECAVLGTKVGELEGTVSELQGKLSNMRELVDTIAGYMNILREYGGHGELEAASEGADPALNPPEREPLPSQAIERDSESMYDSLSIEGTPSGFERALDGEQRVFEHVIHVYSVQTGGQHLLDKHKRRISPGYYVLQHELSELLQSTVNKKISNFGNFTKTSQCKFSVSKAVLISKLLPEVIQTLRSKGIVSDEGRPNQEYSFVPMVDASMVVEAFREKHCAGKSTRERLDRLLHLFRDLTRAGQANQIEYPRGHYVVEKAGSCSSGA
ncbi:hypothetical protein PSENEW3n2_00000907 [Picochlorum sp. SENEW3]|nr:hypothetical protein PSENEW3n2_00000907 [Picochlorum sp. SENEW3]WPT14963.1 hypothetical protein PSENEW3_00000907 [Picochlorum sp. SENEW3]